MNSASVACGSVIKIQYSCHQSPKGRGETRWSWRQWNNSWKAPKFGKGYTPTSRGAEKSANRIKWNISVPRRIVVKLLKIKERKLESRQKGCTTYRGKSKPNGFLMRNNGGRKGVSAFSRAERKELLTQNPTSRENIL